VSAGIFGDSGSGSSFHFCGALLQLNPNRFGILGCFLIGDEQFTLHSDGEHELES
jgi:hypothetical protein